jgi:hypothetical protein
MYSVYSDFYNTSEVLGLAEVVGLALMIQISQNAAAYNA